MNSEKLASWLKQLSKFRKNELIELGEYNSFSEAEACYYQDETDEIDKAIDELEGKCSCSAEPMTIDFAIQHALDVAENGKSDCARQHKQLAEWLQELKEKRTQLQYLAADFDNYKKRSLQREAGYSYSATKGVIEDFLRIYDELEKLVKALDEKMPAEKMLSATCDDPLQIAVRMTFKNFTNLLNAEGCFKIECSYGDKFNPDTMEAISVRDIRDDEGYDSDDVVEIFQTGWKMHGPTGDIMIRPAKVIVGK